MVCEGKAALSRQQLEDVWGVQDGVEKSCPEEDFPLERAHLKQFHIEFQLQRV